MSRELLENLNGNKRGHFHKWLSKFKGEPRIAWYPSAGEDFRDLLCLHRGFSERYPAEAPEPGPPDLFLHSDYFPWKYSQFLDSRVIHLDERTSVIVNHIEELPRCDLPLDDRIVDFPEGSQATGRVLFLDIEVKSNVLGKFSAPVVYVFAENGAFCARRILPNKGKFSHIVHIRYGGGLGGGGKSSGIWLLNVLKRTGCECLVTDRHYHRQSGDERTYELYPELAGPENNHQFQSIRRIPSESWSRHGDVFWELPGNVDDRPH